MDKTTLILSNKFKFNAAKFYMKPGFEKEKYF